MVDMNGKFCICKREFFFIWKKIVLRLDCEEPHNGSKVLMLANFITKHWEICDGNFWLIVE